MTRRFHENIYNRFLRIQAKIPSKQLLLFNVTEGWVPLCSFLGHPIPNKPFPYVDTLYNLENQVRADPDKFRGRCPAPAPPFPPEFFFVSWKNANANKSVNVN